LVIAAPTSCACCGGIRLAKLGEDVIETLERDPASVEGNPACSREIHLSRLREDQPNPSTIQPSAARLGEAGQGSVGKADGMPAEGGPNLLAMILFEKFGQHQPLNRQAERYARGGVPLSLSTLADQVGACTFVLQPLLALLQAHVLAAERLHGDDTTVPVLARGKTDTMMSFRARSAAMIGILKARLKIVGECPGPRDSRVFMKSNRVSGHRHFPSMLRESARPGSSRL